MSSLSFASAPIIQTCYYGSEFLTKTPQKHKEKGLSAVLTWAEAAFRRTFCTVDLYSQLLCYFSMDTMKWKDIKNDINFRIQIKADLV